MQRGKFHLPLCIFGYFVQICTLVLRHIAYNMQIFDGLTVFEHRYVNKFRPNLDVYQLRLAVVFRLQACYDGGSQTQTIFFFERSPQA